jgi:hypothetical protein
MNLLRGAGLAALVALTGCAAEGGLGGGHRTYYADLQGGARVCTVPPRVSLSNGSTTEVAMTVGNDGGWCGISVSRFGGPYDNGLLMQRPQHGRVHVRKVGSATRVDYYPDAGFRGTDSFVVKLNPGEASMKVNVTVQPGSAAAAAAPAPAAAPARR